MASGAIKGLTVEIGGDTTKLGKALDSVEKKSKSLSSELGQINKLLKMDPGNAELLAQKQKVLADAVEQTAKKLETLKTASAQAAKTAGNYDAWLEKITPINVKIEETVQSLEEMRAAAKAAKADFGIESEEYAKAAASVTELEATLRELRKQAKAVNDEFGNPISPEQYRDLQREIIATENKLKGYKNAADETAEAVEKLGKAGANVSLSKTVAKQAADLKDLKAQYTDVVAAQGKQSAAAKALESDIKSLSSELKNNKDKLAEAEKAADEAAGELDDFGDAAEKAEKSSGNLGSVLAGAVKTGLAAVGTIAAAAVTGLVAAAEGTREYRTEMGKLNTAFAQNGFSAEQARSAYSGLVGILAETDQSVEAANHLAKLTDNEKDLATWTGDILPGVFATFGDSLPIEGLTEAANETAKVGQVTGPLADAINWATTESSAWGKALSGNSEALSAFNAAIAEGENAEDAYNAALATCSTEQERQALITQTLASLYGEASDAYKKTNAEVIRANQANDAWMQSMAGIGGAIEPIITDVKMMGASLLSEAVPGVQALAEAFRGLINGEDGAAADFAAAVSGMVSGLVNKLTEALPTIAQTGLSIITTLATSLGQSLPMLLSAGSQIIGQLLSGISSSFPDVAQSALSAVGKFVESLASGLPKVLDKGREILVNLSKGIAAGLPDLVSQGLDIMMNFAQTIYDAAPKLVNTGFDVLGNLISGIVQSLPTLIEKAPEIISKFANAINDNVPVILSKGVALVGQLVAGIVSAIPTLIANVPQIVMAIVDTIQAFNWMQLGKNIITFLKNGIKSMVGAVKTAGTDVLNTITDALKSLPSKLLDLGKNALTNLESAITGARSAVAAAGGNILNAIINAVKNLPSKLLSLGNDAVSKLGSAISSGVSSVKSKAVSIFNSIVDAGKSIPSKMVSIGKDVINGVISGISSMVGKLYDSIKSALSGLVSKAKAALGINSPSKVFANVVGRAIPEGVAVGTEKYASVAEKAVTGMADDVLAAANAEMEGMKLDGPTIGGLSMERGLQQRATVTQTASAAAATTSGIGTKLDKILEAIERGQILTIDSKKLIGATAAGYDSKLGQLRTLAELGAL